MSNKESIKEKENKPNYVFTIPDQVKIDQKMLGQCGHNYIYKNFSSPKSPDGRQQIKKLDFSEANDLIKKSTIDLSKSESYSN
jgi:hypothetical protein